MSTPPPPPHPPFLIFPHKVGRAPASRTVASDLRMAAKGAVAPTKNFWEGEWVCADCGYIYDVDDCAGLYLEEQVNVFFLFFFVPF